MRIFSSCYSLMSEIFRDVSEHGVIVHPQTMQNKQVAGNEDFATKELLNYSYCLMEMPDEDKLFITNPTQNKEWCQKEFTERISSEVNPGKAWLIRKDVWKPFLNSNGKFCYTYSERLSHNHNLERIIDELRAHPDSRQCFLPIFHPMDITYLGGKKRIPCSLGYQFIIREGLLHMTYFQRSADIAEHFGNDVWLAYRMLKFVAERVGVKPGYLFHNITSLHAYKKDWDKLKTCIDQLYE